MALNKIFPYLHPLVNGRQFWMPFCLFIFIFIFCFFLVLSILPRDEFSFLPQLTSLLPKALTLV